MNYKRNLWYASKGGMNIHENTKQYLLQLTMNILWKVCMKRYLEYAICMKIYLEFAWKHTLSMHEKVLSPLSIWSGAQLKVFTHHSHTKNICFQTLQIKCSPFCDKCSSDLFSYLTFCHTLVQCLHYDCYIYSDTENAFDSRIWWNTSACVQVPRLTGSWATTVRRQCYPNTRNQGQHVLEAHGLLLYLASMLSYVSNQSTALRPLQ